MEHFYQSIPGWCDYAEYYRDVVQSLPDGAHLVEMGVWQGQSTAALAVEIANSGKVLRLDVVDHFRGSDDHLPNGAVGFPDLQERFEAHIAPVRRWVRDIHAMESTFAARLYAPGSLDFVWIDGSHDAKSVLADLNAWWPAVKPGGIMAGHDLDWPTVQIALVPWAEMSGVEPRTVSTRSWEIRKPLAVTDWRVPDGERRCLVCVASNERTIYRATVKSLMDMGWGARVQKAAQAHGFEDIQWAWVDRHVRVDDLRNEACVMATGLGASHILFLDADMTWPSDLLTRMLRHHDRGIVSGLYFLKAWPHWPVSLRDQYVNLKTGNVDYLYDDEIAMHDELRPQALVGMGCTLVPTALMRAMPRPWFEYRQNEYGVWTITEDVAFCQKAAAVGCPIWVDPTVKCGHIGTEPVTEPWFVRAQVEQKAIADVRKRQAVSV